MFRWADDEKDVDGGNYLKRKEGRKEGRKSYTDEEFILGGRSDEDRTRREKNVVTNVCVTVLMAHPFGVAQFRYEK